jgi:hypothetical protein
VNSILVEKIIGEEKISYQSQKFVDIEKHVQAALESQKTDDALRIITI